MDKIRDSGSIRILTVGLIFVFAVGVVFYIHFLFGTRIKTQEEDIYYYWVEGERILSGQNPYTRVLSGDMRNNDKYATHFPLFYLLSAATQKAGLRDYTRWVSSWRIIFILFNLGVAYLIFHVFYHSKLYLFSIFASLFWLFNRWTIDVMRIGQIDFIPIFFLVLSLMIFKKHKWQSLFILGISLALKGISIILVPLYLIWFWQATEKSKAQKLSLAILAIFSVPVLISLPFIFWNAEGFFKSLLFNITRRALSNFTMPPIDLLLGLDGIFARLPMLILMALAYLCASRYKIGMYVSVLLLISIFIGFNTTLFRHYFCWVFPFVPLAVHDCIQSGYVCSKKG